MKIVRTSTGNFPEQVQEFFADDGILGIYNYLLQLLNTKFFPFDTAESMWLVLCEGKEAFLLHQNKGVTSYGCFGSLNMSDEVILQTVYFQTSEARAEYLFKEFNGAVIEMYFAARWDEYKSYQISTQIESQWAEKWGISLADNQAAVSNNVKEAYELLSMIMKRPGMYVGAHRVDLARIYFDGWRHHQRCMWDISYDLECWLFRTEGVSFVGSILAWSLFYAYFGAEDIGVEKFRAFLADTTPTSHIAHQVPASITSQIGAVMYSFHRPYQEMYGLAEYCDFDMDKDGITEEQLVNQVLWLVHRLLPESSEQIKLYINKRSLYTQVRIFIRQNGEWADSVDICTEAEETAQLIVLHAYLYNVINWHKNQIMVITSQDEYLHWELKPYEAPHHPDVLNQAPEQLLMYRQFEQWYQEQAW